MIGAGGERRSRDIRTAVLLGLTVALGFSLRDLHREWIVRQSELTLERQTLALQRGDPPAVADMPAPGAGAPARALVHRALYLARLSEAQSPGPGRARTIAAAWSNIDAALARRPHWGEAWTVRTYIGSVCQCEPAAATAKALQHSYADAPFLRGAAPWRVKLGLKLWPLLSPAGQAFVIDEGVWSTRSDDDAREDLFAAFRDSVAYERFFVRWRQFRHGDADMLGIGAPTP